MKVLVVSSMYPTTANPIGGIFIHEQVKALRRIGIDARVASGKPLWLSGRNPRAVVTAVREEWRARKRRFAWQDYDGVPSLQFNYFAGALSRPWLYPFIYRNALASLLDQIGQLFPYEIVHTHTAFLDGRAGAAAAKFRAVPMVLTEHTGPFSLVTEDWRFRQHTLAAMKSADQLIAVSHALRKEIARRLPQIDENSISVVPNGVDTRFFDPGMDIKSGMDGGCSPNIGPESGVARQLSDRWPDILKMAKTELVLAGFLLGLRESLRDFGDRPMTGRELAAALEVATLTGIGEGPFRKQLAAAGLPVKFDPAIDRDARQYDENDRGKRILWVGHLVAVKRVDRLLDAFAIALRRRPGLKLRIVGGGELEAKLRDQANTLGLSRDVTFRPAASREVIRHEMRAADFLVISSDTETFGVVGIEAMAMGLPVLTTNCGGPADYVVSGQNGESVGNSTEELAIGIQRMVDESIRMDKSKIRQHIVQHFDFDVVVRRLSEVYGGASRLEKFRGSAAALKRLQA